MDLFVFLDYKELQQSLEHMKTEVLFLQFNSRENIFTHCSKSHTLCTLHEQFILNYFR